MLGLLFLALIVPTTCLTIYLPAGFQLLTIEEENGAQYATPKITVEELMEKRKLAKAKDPSLPLMVVLYYRVKIIHLGQSPLPIFENAAKHFAKHDPPIHFVRCRLDSDVETVNEEFENEDNQESIVAYDNDGNTHVFSDFPTGFKLAQLTSWVSNMLSAHDYVLKDVTDIDTYLQDNDYVVMGLFNSAEDKEAFGHIAKGGQFDHVVFSSTTDEKVAADVAKFLEDHHEHNVVPMDVGPSSGDSAVEVKMPYEGMDCNPDPTNLQDPSWTDKFEIHVDEKTMTVKRVDTPGEGWGQNLQLKCFVKLANDAHKNRKKIVVPVPSVVMFADHKQITPINKDSDKFNVYQDFPLDKTALTNFIMTHLKPIVSYMTNDVFQHITSLTRMPMIVLFVHGDLEASDEVKKEAENAFMQAAMRFERHRITAYIVKDKFDGIDKFARFTKAQQGPCIRVLKRTDVKWLLFEYDQEGSSLTEDKIVEFHKNFLDDKVPPVLKSQPVPTEPTEDDEPLTIVGSTFYKYAHDDTIDTFVYISASGSICEICQTFLRATWMKFAVAFADNKGILIAQMDGEHNEAADLIIDYVPQLVFYPAKKDSKPEIFDDARTEENILAFIKKHAINPTTHDPLLSNSVEMKAARRKRLKLRHEEKVMPTMAPELLDQNPEKDDLMRRGKEEL